MKVVKTTMLLSAYMVVSMLFFSAPSAAQICSTTGKPDKIKVASIPLDYTTNGELSKNSIDALTAISTYSAGQELILDFKSSDVSSQLYQLTTGSVENSNWVNEINLTTRPTVANFSEKPLFEHLTSPLSESTIFKAIQAVSLGLSPSPEYIIDGVDVTPIQRSKPEPTTIGTSNPFSPSAAHRDPIDVQKIQEGKLADAVVLITYETPSPYNCLLYTSPSPRDATLSRMPSSA